MKADLHIHTNFSFDGQSSPKEVVYWAINNGIDCICITDHGEIQGAVEVMKESFDKNLLVIPGIEIFSRAGDVLGINVKKIIPNNLSLEQTVEEVHKQGGLAIIPHPFGWPGVAGFWGRKSKMREYPINGIEIFNASVIFNFSNRRAFDFSFNNNLSYTAGSDAHLAEFVGRGYLEISDPILSEKDIIEAILMKKGRIKGQPLSFVELLKNGGGPHSYFDLFNRAFKYYSRPIKKIITRGES